MKAIAIAVAAVALLALGFWITHKQGEPTWSGVDETVVEKFAEEAGRSPRDPYINTDQGDLLLLVFLLAGAAGGFVAGYYFRELFPAKTKSSAGAAPHV